MFKVWELKSPRKKIALKKNVVLSALAMVIKSILVNQSIVNASTVQVLTNVLATNAINLLKRNFILTVLFSVYLWVKILSQKLATYSKIERAKLVFGQHGSIFKGQN